MMSSSSTKKPAAPKPVSPRGPQSKASLKKEKKVPTIKKNDPGATPKPKTLSPRSYRDQLLRTPIRPASKRALSPGEISESQEGYDVTRLPGDSDEKDFFKRNPKNSRGARALGSPLKVVHNGSPSDSDEEGWKAYWEKDARRRTEHERAQYPQMPPPDKWPVEATKTNLLSRAWLKPADYDDNFGTYVI